MSREYSTGSYDYQAALLHREGHGPWQRSKERWLPSYYSGCDYDNTANDQVGKTKLAILPSDSQSSSTAERLFFRVPDMQFTYYGQPHTLDLFVSGEDLDLASHPQKTIRQWEAKDYYEVDIKRLAFAQSKGHQESTNALTVLHTLATEGKKIAYIRSHGIRKDGEWHVYSDGESEPINDVIRDLASQTTANGVQKYHALYFNACNSFGTTPDMSGITIPVLANTAMNGPSAEGNIKVFFPNKTIPTE